MLVTSLNRQTINVTPLVLCMALVFAACDSGGSEGTEQFTTINGVVTDDSGFGKSAGPVSDATVVPREYDETGDGSELEGSDQTSAQGEYELSVESASNLFILSASSGTFSSSVIAARATGDAVIQAMPMNDETDAEASVFASARGNGMTLSHVDAALLVDASLAAAIHSGSVSSLAVATIAYDGAQTEEAYTASGDDEQPVDRRQDRDDRRVAAFLELQAALAATADSAAEHTAVAAFESSYVQSGVEAGIDAEVQARASLARRRTVADATADAGISSSAEFEMNKRAAIMAAASVRTAVEAAFSEFGSAASVVAQLEASGNAMLTAMAEADSQAELDVASADYSADVEAQLEVEANVTHVAILAAKTAAETAETTLEAALSVAGTAAARAQAFAVFFSSAETAFEASLSVSANSSFGARVLTVLALN